MYDLVIVGAGIAGCVLAREMAEKGRQVLIIEKKNHIGGNCYDEKDAYGVLIHPYGPHIYHSSIERVHSFLSRFTKWREFKHEVVADVHGRYMPVPFNLHTLADAFDEETSERMKDKLIEIYGMGTKVPILGLMQHSDVDLQRVGQYVYDNIYVYYTMKQWGKKPEEIDPAVTARVPVNISYDNGYFGDKYQGVPLDGYTSMFCHMLDHNNIDIKLNTESKDVLEMDGQDIRYQGEKLKGNIVYTGPLDEFFDCRYGRLPYRTLRFAFEHYEMPDYQGHSVVNYTVSEDYTRITEYKRLTGQVCEGTTISKEYAYAYTGEKGQIPYYAISNSANEQLYEQYKKEAEKLNGFYLLGRLAEYKYYNMDVMADKALKLADQLI